MKDSGVALLILLDPCESSRHDHHRGEMKMNHFLLNPNCMHERAKIKDFQNLKQLMIMTMKMMRRKNAKEYSFKQPTDDLMRRRVLSGKWWELKLRILPNHWVSWTDDVDSVSSQLQHQQEEENRPWLWALIQASSWKEVGERIMSVIQNDRHLEDGESWVGSRCKCLLSHSTSAPYCLPCFLINQWEEEKEKEGDQTRVINVQNVQNVASYEMAGGKKTRKIRDVFRAKCPLLLLLLLLLIHLLLLLLLPQSWLDAILSDSIEWFFAPETTQKKLWSEL